MIADIMFIFLDATLQNTFISGNSYYYDITNNLILKYTILRACNLNSLYITIYLEHNVPTFLVLGVGQIFRILFWIPVS